MCVLGGLDVVDTLDLDEAGLGMCSVLATLVGQVTSPGTFYQLLSI